MRILYDLFTFILDAARFTSDKAEISDPYNGSIVELSSSRITSPLSGIGYIVPASQARC